MAARLKNVHQYWSPQYVFIFDTLYLICTLYWITIFYLICPAYRVGEGKWGQRVSLVLGGKTVGKTRVRTRSVQVRIPSIYFNVILHLLSSSSFHQYFHSCNLTIIIIAFIISFSACIQFKLLLVLVLEKCQ